MAGIMSNLKHLIKKNFFYFFSSNFEKSVLEEESNPLLNIPIIDQSQGEKLENMFFNNIYPVSVSN